MSDCIDGCDPAGIAGAMEWEGDPDALVVAQAPPQPVRLTSWGTTHEFDVTELRQERRAGDLPALRPAA